MAHKNHTESHPSAPTAPEKRRSPIWLQAAISIWILAAQLWYYLQFKQQFQSILSLTLRRLWH